MKCTGCQYEHSSVVYTRNDEVRNQTTRRRECLKCGLRFTTCEQPKVMRNSSASRLLQGSTK